MDYINNYQGQSATKRLEQILLKAKENALEKDDPVFAMECDFLLEEYVYNVMRGV